MDATQHSSTPVEQEHPNADTIAGLCAAADWLVQHPELPKVWWASINFRSLYLSSERSREQLMMFAAALGDRAKETFDGSTVAISAKFGPLEVKCGAPVDDLRDEPTPPAPKYEPIIKRAEIPVTDDEDEAWSAVA